eukprot:47092-Pyramimonas_sp.AAC.1
MGSRGGPEGVQRGSILGPGWGGRSLERCECPLLVQAVLQCWCRQCYSGAAVLQCWRWQCYSVGAGSVTQPSSVGLPLLACLRHTLLKGRAVVRMRSQAASYEDADIVAQRNPVDRLPGMSWVTDVVRGTLVANSAEQILDVWNTLQVWGPLEHVASIVVQTLSGEADEHVASIVLQTRAGKQMSMLQEDRDWEIVRVKNRFHTPLINEGRHILVSIRMRSTEFDHPNLWHVCEFQVSSPLHPPPSPHPDSCRSRAKRSLRGPFRSPSGRRGDPRVCGADSVVAHLAQIHEKKCYEYGIAQTLARSTAFLRPYFSHGFSQCSNSVKKLNDVTR